MYQRFLLLINSQRNSIFSYANFFVTAVFFLYFQKFYIAKFGVQAYGKFSVSYSFFAVMVQLLEFTYMFSTPHWLKDDKYKVAELLGTRKLGLIVLTVFLFIAFIVGLFSHIEPWLILFLIGSSLINYWYFLYYERLKSAFTFNLLSKVISVSLLLLLPLNETRAIVIFGLSFFICGVFSLVKIIKNERNSFSLSKAKQIFKEDTYFFSGRLATIIYSVSLFYLWGYIYPYKYIGEISSVYRVVTILQSLIPPITSVLLVRIIKEGRPSIKDIFSDSFILILYLSFFILGGIGYIYTKEILSFVTGHHSELSIFSLKVMLVNPLILLTSSLIMNVYIIGRGEKVLWVKIVHLTLALSVLFQAVCYFTFEKWSTLPVLSFTFNELIILVLSLIAVKYVKK